VTYCAGDDCHASAEGAKQLAALGFTVQAYEGGISEWKAAGYPTE
jgi:rhodanese-related sulfurtransferase